MRRSGRFRSLRSVSSLSWSSASWVVSRSRPSHRPACLAISGSRSGPNSSSVTSTMATISPSPMLNTIQLLASRLVGRGDLQDELTVTAEDRDRHRHADVGLAEGDGQLVSGPHRLVVEADDQVAPAQAGRG